MQVTKPRKCNIKKERDRFREKNSGLSHILDCVYIFKFQVQFYREKRKGGGVGWEKEKGHTLKK